MKINYGLIFLLSSFWWWQCALASEKIFSQAEIQLHKTANDCWIIVNNKVYDITKFITDHDKRCNEMKLSDFCGKNASAKWSEKENSSHPHKSRSVLRLEGSVIGKTDTTL